MLKGRPFTAQIWAARPCLQFALHCCKLSPLTNSQSFKQASRKMAMNFGAHASASSTYSMGPGTLAVDRARLHGGARSRLVSALQAALPSSQQGIMLLQGGGPFHVYSTDGEGVFKQESYFHYLFGVREEDFYGAVDVRSGDTILFMPRLPDAYAVWMGALKSTDDVRQQYAVDKVQYVDEMAEALAALAAPCLHVLSGTNTDSGMAVKPPTFEGVDQFQLETATLFDVLTELRVIKAPEEIDIIRYANQVGSAAHVKLMQACKPGMLEYQLEATFLHHAYYHGGCRLAMYTPISASGPNGAILHYGHAGAPNDRQIGPGEMLLVDMGCEYAKYGSDITTSFPSDGIFTPRQRVIYEAVLAAQQAVLQAMKPGVAWPDMHSLANRTILEGLLAGGLVRGNVDDMMAVHLGGLFMPHGLGHFLGLDTHDVGGYSPGSPGRIQLPGFKSLRTARVLQPGMVITVEPGCYFNPTLLLPALKDPTYAPFLVEDQTLSHLNFGGVRIEDNVIVTESGAESLTNVPRTVAEVEAVMAGGEWPLAAA